MSRQREAILKEVDDLGREERRCSGRLEHLEANIYHTFIELECAYLSPSD